MAGQLQLSVPQQWLPLFFFLCWVYFKSVLEEHFQLQDQLTYSFAVAGLDFSSSLPASNCLMTNCTSNKEKDCVHSSITQNDELFRTLFPRDEF